LAEALATYNEYKKNPKIMKRLNVKAKHAYLSHASNIKYYFLFLDLYECVSLNILEKMKSSEIYVVENIKNNEPYVRINHTDSSNSFCA